MWIGNVECEEVLETLGHLRKHPEVREEERPIETILNNDGSKWMRKIVERRR